MASPGSEFNYACKLCPRTFKLQEFYNKHEKVHQLKKQHVCKVCGFVYGAAKGLEGHMDSAHPEPVSATHSSTPPIVRRIEQPEDLSPQIPEMPFFHFLQAQGLLTSNEVYKQAQQAMMAQMTNTTKNLQLVPISITAPASPSPTGSLSQKPNDKSKIPSPAGTGNYKIYDQVPEIQDASDAQQNDSGFFRCTICTREFSGLNSLKKHVPIHTRRVQHKCDTCGYVFGKKEYLLDHMRKHSGELSPVCEVCGQTFNKSLKLKEHQKLHRNTEKDGSTHQYSPYRCHICKQCFSRPDPLGDHLRTAHSETVYKCDMCDATFGDVRGKNHHMYNEHQLDAFHQKCVWCPVCNQGFTRHYNLKVHMYKSHGKEYLENNFSQEELDNLMRPPPGSNTSKASPSPRKNSTGTETESECGVAGSPTSGVLPISPPLTPKLSPKLRTGAPARGEDSPTLVPSSSCIPSASSLKENNKENNNNNNNNNNTVKRSRPGPASLTKPQHYFDQEAQHAMLKCQLCEEKFLRKSDLFIHLKQHGVRVLSCELCEDRFLEIADLKKHMSAVHGQEDAESKGQKRRPGPASRTNAPREQRAVPSNLPTHLAAHCPESPGYPCQQCGKVLMHKQSYVSHMRVIHGDYYGGNKWKGSSVVEMVLGNNQHKVPQSNNNTESQPRDYSDYHKFGQACEFCNKAFSDPSQLDEHIASKHPNLTRRIQAFKAALGLKDSEQEPDTKRFKLDYKGIFKDQNENSLSSYSVLSFSHAPDAHLSSSGYPDEPLDLACKPVSVDVDQQVESERVHDSNNNHGQHLSNNLLQLARPQPVSPPCSPLNLHVPRPATPSPSPSPPPPTSEPSQPPAYTSQPIHISLVQPTSLLMTAPSHSLPQPQPPLSHQEEDEENTHGAGHTDPNQPKLHEYLVKQSNATSDENGRKKFLCPVCKCQLSWKTNLSVHLRTHSGERPFQCVLCFNRFRQKAHLYKHFRCSHGHKVAPYQCMFCTESFSRSPNDLYNHITEVHKRETDELTNNNNNNNENNNNINIKMESEADSFPQKVTIQQEKKTITLEEKREEIKILESNHRVEEEEEDDEDEDEDIQVEDEYEGEEEPLQIKDRSDDVRYEAIEEEFEFSGEKIQPCYCVLPFVSDEEVEGMTKRNIAEYYEQPEEYSSEDEEGEMVIDENPPPDSPEDLAARRTPASQQASPRPLAVTSNYNNNELKVNNFGQSFADAINICRKEALTAPSSLARLQQQPEPTHTVKFEPQQSALLYPSFPDFSLPFSLSGLIQKKKAEMAAILAPRMSPKPADTSRLTLDHLSKAAMSVKPPVSPATSHKSHSSSHGGESTTNTAVSEYENQIQNDLWPIDCIKCTSVLTNLDNFNVHMNDHWSDDKCCPVCGLLINSKRFNFKQHLKIHTGEKPFVCQVCSRAFRQKAHMVKHVTTHRTEPRAVPESLLAYQTENGGYQPGVIVQ